MRDKLEPRPMLDHHTCQLRMKEVHRHRRTFLTVSSYCSIHTVGVLRFWVETLTRNAPFWYANGDGNARRPRVIRWQMNGYPEGLW